MTAPRDTSLDRPSRMSTLGFKRCECCHGVFLAVTRRKFCSDECGSRGRGARDRQRLREIREANGRKAR
jgi:hypothetical protein